MIKKHNFPGNAPEQQIQSTQPYLKQLQEIYEKKTRQNEQLVIWTPPEQENEKAKRKTHTKEPSKNRN